LIRHVHFLLICFQCLTSCFGKPFSRVCHSVFPLRASA
jgi:hypothetical protein